MPSSLFGAVPEVAAGANCLSSAAISSFGTPARLSVSTVSSRVNFALILLHQILWK